MGFQSIVNNNADTKGETILQNDSLHLQNSIQDDQDNEKSPTQRDLFRKHQEAMNQSILSQADLAFANLS